MNEHSQLALLEVLPADAKQSNRWPGIYVTPDGANVYRFSKGSRHGRHCWRRLKQTLTDGSGYPAINKHSGGQQELIRIHTLVMDAFGPPSPSPWHEIRHVNGNRRDNRIQNLAWAPPLAAMRDGLQKRRERLEAAKNKTEERRRPG